MFAGRWGWLPVPWGFLEKKNSPGPGCIFVWIKHLHLPHTHRLFLIIENKKQQGREGGGRFGTWEMVLARLLQPGSRECPQTATYSCFEAPLCWTSEKNLGERSSFMRCKESPSDAWIHHSFMRKHWKAAHLLRSVGKHPELHFYQCIISQAQSCI